MREITTAIIHDLLPVYLSGDASDDTRAVIEEQLEQDPELRRLMESLSASPVSGALEDLAQAEWQSLHRTRALLRRRNVWLAAATALTALLAATVLPAGGILAPHGSRMLPAALLLMATLTAWVAFLATCRSLVPTGLEPPVGGRGWRLRIYWGLAGFLLGTIGGEILGAALSWAAAPTWIGILAGILAMALGEKWRQIPRPEEIAPPVSILGPGKWS